MIYDIALIGLGASNSLLLLELHNRGVLNDLDVLILETESKWKNDKTYCFWGDHSDPIFSTLRPLMLKEWTKLNFDGDEEQLTSMRYGMLESLTLYEFSKGIILQYPKINLVRAPLTNFESDSDGIKVYSDNTEWMARRVFDSRPPDIKEPTGPLVLQSFLGWRVKTDWPNWDPSCLTLMDFNIPQNGFTQFMYILPIDETEALVEVTRFGSEVFPKELATNHLKNYLLGLDGPYEITHEEQGVIPMTQHALQQHPDARIISMGARGGLIKSTTGYGFKYMYEKAVELAQDVENQVFIHKDQFWNLPRTGISRHYFYDHLLLHILKYKPQWGKQIFTKLFSNRSHEGIFRFLDEKSSLGWEVGMFAGLPIMKFLWAVVASFFAFLKTRPARWAPMAMVLTASGLQALIPQSSQLISLGILMLMLLLIGIPHGALDGYGHANGMRLPKFILRYSGIMAIVLLFWVASPILGLLTFLLYSAWHFGETDMREWDLPSPILSMVWGIILFTLLLFPHLSEVNVVLETMGVSEVAISERLLNTIYLSAAAIGIIGGLWFASVPWLISISTLLLLGEQSLAIAFGTYFVLQHSTSGWDHLKKAHNWSNVQMFIRALPFTLGAVALFLVIFQFDRNSLSQWSSYFLIFLSALSLPHIYFMSRLYQKQN